MSISIRYLYSLALLFAIGLASCTKTINTIEVVGAGAPKLEVVPNQLHGVEYKLYTFKARVNGLGASDYYLNWDFGTAVPNSPYVHYSSDVPITNVEFTQPGTFTVRVNAYDNFNDTLIDQDTFTVTIDSTIKKVTLFPHSFDTTVFTNVDGSFTSPFPFLASVSNSSYQFSYVYHITGSNFDSTSYSSDSVLYLVFPHIGSYHVTVTALDSHGQIYGSDSGDVYFGFPPLSDGAMELFKSITIFFLPDSTLNVPRTGGVALLSKKLNLVNSNTQTVAWQNNAVEVTYNNDNSTDPATQLLSNDTASVIFSTDFNSMTSLLLNFNDADYEGEPGSSLQLQGSRVWGGVMKHLKLFAVTPTQAIYTDTQGQMSGIVQGAYCVRDNKSTRWDMSTYDAVEQTPTFNILTPISGFPPPVPSAFVIFSR